MFSDGRDKLPVGIDDFEEIRTEGFYYVDKTGMIRDLLNNWAKVNLFTRPRRFGKTLNMSMLQHFFEIGRDPSLFAGLEIEKERELCASYMNQFPVIFISLKSVNGPDFESAKSMMSTVIGTEAGRFKFLLGSDRLDEDDKKRYRQLITVASDNMSVYDMSETVMLESLKTLSELLHRHYGKKVILLMDEYDVPLSKADDRGYYDEMVIFIRSFFEQTLKTNAHLQFAVLTGCLRVSKESIFTGLNNLRVLSITNVLYDEYFGFTNEEVRGMLDYYGLDEVYDQVKEWYDGYRFGNMDVYCPWDVICYCADLRADPEKAPEDYWSNTSGNDVIRKFIEKAGAVTKNEIEALISGESVSKTIRQELTYRDLYTSVDNIWSILFMTGYLTQRGKPDGKKLSLAIPNREIQDIFEEQISEWFTDTVLKDAGELDILCAGIKNGDADAVEGTLNRYLGKMISVRDTAVREDQKENFYHGLLLGLLGVKDDWLVLSNRESGEGYSDILVEIRPESIGFVIEIKYAHDGSMERACQAAIEQIEEKDYDAVLRDDRMRTIHKYGIACRGKKCRVVCRTNMM